MACAGCSANSSAPAADALILPVNYRQQVAELLATELHDRSDFSLALIAPPVPMQLGQTQHYVVCVRLNGRNQHADKIAIYLGANITQLIDATPEQCGSAAYEPFKELAALKPS
jgi:hypothetical protein